MIPRRGNYDRPFRRGNWRTGTMARGTRKRARFRKSDRCSSFCSTKRATIVGRIDFLVSLFSIVSSLQENSWGEKLCDSLRSDINLIFILGADSVDSSHLVELYYWGERVRRGFRFCISVAYISLWNFQLSSLSSGITIEYLHTYLSNDILYNLLSFFFKIRKTHFLRRSSSVLINLRKNCVPLFKTFNYLHSSQNSDPTIFIQFSPKHFCFSETQITVFLSWNIIDR